MRLNKELMNNMCNYYVGHRLTLTKKYILICMFFSSRTRILRLRFSRMRVHQSDSFTTSTSNLTYSRKVVLIDNQ